MPFLLKFMAVIHTAYATIKADQRDALACENTSLSHASRFGEKAAQEQATKATKAKGGNTPSMVSASKPLIGNSPWIPSASKGTNVASASTLAPADQKVIDLDPNNLDKKHQISDNLDTK
jgi:hypothetical protein